MKPHLRELTAEEASDPAVATQRLTEILTEAMRLVPLAFAPSPPADVWLGEEGVKRRFGLTMRTLIEAADRGESISVHFAAGGDKRRFKPRVRAADVERWLRERKPARPRPATPLATIDVTADLRAAAKRRLDDHRAAKRSA